MRLITCIFQASSHKTYSRNYNFPPPIMSSSSPPSLDNLPDILSKKVADFLRPGGAFQVGYSSKSLSKEFFSFQDSAFAPSSTISFAGLGFIAFEIAEAGKPRTLACFQNALNAVSEGEAQLAKFSGRRGGEKQVGGFIFEVVHVSTFNADAALKGLPPRAARTAYLGRPHDVTDVVVNKKGLPIEEWHYGYQLKSGATASKKIMDPKYKNLGKVIPMSAKVPIGVSTQIIQGGAMSMPVTQEQLDAITRRVLSGQPGLNCVNRLIIPKAVHFCAGRVFFVAGVGCSVYTNTRKAMQTRSQPVQQQLQFSKIMSNSTPD